MTKFTFAIIFLLSTSQQILACDCVPIKNVERALNAEYDHVENVFRAEVKWFNSDSTEFKLTILEVFKGDLKKGQTITGINEGTCGPYIDKFGEWLLYGDLISAKFKVNDCGLSTNVHDPLRTFPPPPPPDLEDEMGSDYIEKYRIEAKKIVADQIKKLKKKKPVPNNK